jgi:Epoxide hydrolase N terminus
MTEEIRRFQVDVPQEELDDLRRRVATMRWPDRELVDDRSQGVQLATIQALASHWATHDWRNVEARPPRRPIRTSSTTTASPRAGTSPRGSSPPCSRRR